MERILVIGMSGDCGGIENYLLNMYEHIDRNKIQFDFLVKESVGSYFQTRIDRLGGHIYETGILKKNIIGTWRKIRAVYKEGAYSKVYINLSYALTLLYILPGLNEQIKQVFIHSHASDDFRKSKHYFSRVLLLKSISRRAKVFFLGCSDEACDWMFGKGNIGKNGYTVIKNAIDRKRFLYNAEIGKSIRKELHLDNAFVVGHVGRFSEEKNHAFIIRAFDELHKKDDNTRLLLVGDGYLQNEIREKVRELGIAGAVVFTGMVNSPEQYYNAMDCLWMPSIFEGLPLVAIEAEANGLSCIFSDHITKAVDIVKNNSFLPIDNINGFVEKTQELKKGYDRTVDWELFIRAGYDITHEAQRLERLLLNKDI